MTGTICKRPRGRPTPIIQLAADPELSPEERLALCVVVQAAFDLARLRRKKTDLLQVERGVWLDLDELLAFFRSRWCNVLLGTTGMSGVELLERMGL